MYRTRDREHIASGLSRQARGDQRAGAQGCLDNQDTTREAGDDAVAPWEVVRDRRSAQRELRDDEAFGADALCQGAIARGVDCIDTGADDREKLGLLESYLERMRGTIYAQAMYADFELAMHERVEQGLPLTASWLEATWLEKFRYYMGTSKGVLKDADCRRQKAGGELLCNVW